MLRYVTILCLLLGFVVGYLAAQQQDRKETMQKTLQLERILSEIRSAEATMEKTNAIEAMDRTEEYYAASGKIRKRVIISSTKKLAQEKETHKEQVTVTDTQKAVQTIIAPTSHKNWLVGAQLSTADAQKLHYKSPEIVLGYRLVGTLYATATTDVAFKNPKIGLTITF